jgi:hypothetical protein
VTALFIELYLDEDVSAIVATLVPAEDLLQQRHAKRDNLEMMMMSNLNMQSITEERS